MQWGSGHCCGSGLIFGLETCTCRRHRPPPSKFTDSKVSDQTADLESLAKGSENLGVWVFNPLPPLLPPPGECDVAGLELHLGTTGIDSF